MQPQAKAAKAKITSAATQAAIAANVAKSKAAESAAATSNAKVLAANKTKPAAPKPELKKGNGALIGVADGALDNAPHTKQAVKEARERARLSEQAKFDAEKDERAAKGERYRLDPATGRAKWYATGEKSPVGAVTIYPKPAKGAFKPEPAPKAKAAKVAAPKAPKAAPVAKTYKVLNKAHGAKAGSKRATQLEIVFKHKDTVSAKAAGAENVDFAFAVAKGFIAYN